MENHLLYCRMLYPCAHTHVFSKRDRGECVHRRHPFLTESSSRVRATLVRSDLADVRCVTSGCTFYLQKKKVHNKSSDLSGGTGFSECEGPRKMRFPRGAARRVSRFRNSKDTVAATLHVERNTVG